MSISDREWTLEREGKPFAQRFRGAISDDAHTISGRWEKAEEGGDFSIDFYLTYHKVL
jgi:hypothetical protein